MHRMQLAWLVTAGVLALGCGDDGGGDSMDAQVPGDGSTNGDDGGPPGDDGGTGFDAGPQFDECMFTDPAGVSSFSATLVEFGAGTPPTGTGGDPLGTWVFDAGTFYLDETTSMSVDASMSSATGTAWAQFEAGAFQLKYDLELDLQTTDGPVTRSATLEFGGTYTLSDGTVVFEQSCSTGNVPLARIEFTASASELTLIVEDTAGTVIVLDGAPAG